jgi:signal transduction histidine kinase
LIENALKYSLPRAQIVIKFESSDKYCTIRVSNETELEKPIDSSILMKGIRGSHQTEGSGMGLYLAQIVARQHNTQIEVSCVKLFEKRYRCTFSIRFALLTTNEP